MRTVFRRAIAAVCLLLILLSGWIAFDLTFSETRDLRRFDADEVARLDAAMWRSYYDRDRLRLFLQLGELLGRQYGFRFWRRQLTAFYAAKGAFVFKNGRERTDYEKAMPDIERFFAAVRDSGSNDFDPHRAAELEVEWWIVHRERRRYSEDDLARALANAAAEIYRVQPELLYDYGRFRAQAMRIRDEQGESGGLIEDDWARIEELLERSWHSLHDAVNRSAPIPN